MRTLAQARQALEEAGPFALLILDVNLPDGSGLSLLEEVKGRVPVILLTANDLETDIVAGLELGRRTTLQSPFPWRSSGPGECPAAPGKRRRE